MGMIDCELCGARCRDAFLCPGCTERLGLTLRSIRATLDDLDVLLSRQSRIGEPGRSAAMIDPPLPFDVGASDARRMLIGALGALAPVLAGPTWIRVSLASVRAQAGARDVCEALADALARALAVTDLPADRWYAGQCSAGANVCAEDLYVPAGSTVVQCPRCGAAHDVAARRTILLRHAEDVTATATEISRAVSGFDAHLSASAVRRWAHRGLIVATNSTSGDVPTYRLGDVLHIMDTRRHSEG